MSDVTPGACPHGALIFCSLCFEAYVAEHEVAEEDTEDG